jgi:hypothetical protein
MMLSALVELLGLACLAVAGWLIAPFIGFAVAGVALLVVGQALDGVKVKLPRVKMPKVKWPRLRLASPRPRQPGAAEAS